MKKPVNPTCVARASIVLVAGMGLACADPPFKPLEGVTDLTLGSAGCVVTESGRAFCFGVGAHGPLVAEPVPIEEKVVSIATGGEAACAVVESGDVYCWGRNKHGEVGVGDLVQRDEPTLVSGVRNASEVAIGTGSGAGDFVCVLHDAGLVSCWGLNLHGQVGSMPDDPELCEGNHTEELNAPCVLTPTQVPGLDSVTQLALGREHGCALRENGELWCWGDDEQWALGDFPLGAGYPLSPPYTQRRAGGPVRAEGITALDVAAGVDTTCAIVDDGERLVCWGGEVAWRSDSMIVNPRSSANAGFVMDGNEDLHDVGVGVGFTCTTWGRPKPSIDCWGPDVPTNVHAFATKIAAHDVRVCAIVGGQVWCWSDTTIFGPAGDDKPEHYVIQVPF